MLPRGDASVSQVDYGRLIRDVIVEWPEERQEAFNRLRAEYSEYPEDIVMRLLDEAIEVPGDDGHDTAALLLEAAKTIDNLRHGRGG